MRGVLLVAAVAAFGIAVASSGAAPAATPACPAPALRAAAPSGHARCVGLAERVRIRLVILRGSSAAVVAREHGLTTRAARVIASSPGSVILAGTGPAAKLQAEPGCSFDDGRAEARLSWQPSAAGAQIVVVAPETRGLDGGRFWASGQLKAASSQLVWRRFAGQAVHVWAVLTRERDGWRASESASFTGPLCAVDYHP
jgi:hypothetical protein